MPSKGIVPAMSELIRGTSISEAWLQTLDVVNSQPAGKMVHVLTSASKPWLPEDADIRAALDRVLLPSKRHPRLQSVDTIANTIFPSALYPDPGKSWSPVRGADNQPMTRAAERLYKNYATIFPNLRRAHSENKKGTYFSRMISWPGKDMGGTNQLERRLQHLRSMNSNHKSAFNASDIALAEPACDDDYDLGVNIYAATDHRTRSFPCLVHVDIGVYQNKLNLLGVYRHQYLIQKGYGNMIGLARLQKFLAQQSGYDIGELAVQATFATAEQDMFSKGGVDRLVVVKRQGELEL
jgi:hypothetical protein